MNIGRVLFIVGLTLLAVAALVGFEQHRQRKRPERFAQWRVVHVGGTGGAVQLIALGAAFGHFGVHGAFAASVGAGVSLATWAFFVGPLAQALQFARTGRLVNTVGAVFALPAYVALPFVGMCR